MNGWSLSWRSFQYYWRSQLGVLLGAALSVMVLTGALLAGDSVNQTLVDQSLARVGRADFIFNSGERFVREQLAADLMTEAVVDTAPVMRLDASAAMPDGKRRANQVQAFGVDDRFWNLNGVDSAAMGDDDDPGVAINERLARTLGVDVGDAILLRVEKPSLLSRDAPLSTAGDSTAGYRLTVRAVLGDAQMGRFDLRANQIPPHNAFVPLHWLQSRVERPGRVNLILVKNHEDNSLGAADLNAALKKTWKLDDAELETVEVANQPWTELRGGRIFIDPPAASVAAELSPRAIGVLSYMANILEANGNRTPYSIVSAIGPLHSQGAAPEWVPSSTGAVNVNQWLADDLGLHSGDSLEMTYFVFGPMRNLVERARTFTVGEILSMSGPNLDRSLMPDFPGISNAENCRDWDPGFLINIEAIRDKDEDYWNQYKGAPKAIFALRAGQEMWSNRFGSLTAIRVPSDEFAPDQFAQRLRDALDPASLGFFFTPFRAPALSASRLAMDFGSLFIGLSFFLILAALILLGLLFVFSVEQRGRETGLLLAVGFSPRAVRRFYLREGVFFSLLGGVIGAAAAIVYTRVILWALSTVWSGAVASAQIHFHASSRALLTGVIGGVLMSLLAILFAVRKQASVPARELLNAGLDAGAGGTVSRMRRGWLTLAAAILSALGAVGMAFTADVHNAEQAAGVFFGVGSLLLISILACVRLLISSLERSSRLAARSIAALALSNAARRPGRSLAAVALLACGAFMVIAVGANRQNPLQNAEERESGTGGYALYADTALPLVYDLNTESGLNQFALTRDDVGTIRVTAMRRHDGDEASCLNLNRAQTPRLLGVDPEEFAFRGAFSFAGVMPDMPDDNPWRLLNQTFEDGAIPAIADQKSMMWAMGKSLGDTVEYIDGEGEPFKVRLVAALNNTVLQGSIVIAEEPFLRKYPFETGYHVLLIDAPFSRADELKILLNDYLSDVGIEAMTTRERLAAFTAVENTYLRIFLALGGLGLLLGTAGLAVIVLRNVLERRGELGLLRAVGFTRSEVRRMLLVEHAFLLAAGLAGGGLAGLAAALPSLRAMGAQAPVGELTFALAGLLAAGLFFVWLASRAAMRGEFYAALRNE